MKECAVGEGLLGSEGPGRGLGSEHGPRNT